MKRTQLKTEHMRQLAAHRRTLWEQPELRNLFLELTLRCNERCIHCGSRCGEHAVEELPVEVYYQFLDKIRRDFDGHLPMLCITGGEPLLRREFFDIMGYANRLGFRWGMTTNGTLITDDVAKKLHAAGMRTISVSIDGLEATHDAFRQTPGGYAAAMRGVEALLRHGGFAHVQITTVVHHQSLHELEPLLDVLEDVDIDSWRIFNMEPIGRALEHPELLLTPEDYRWMFDFIRDKRRAGLPVEYGCMHYLGLDYEREVRDWYFLCNAGIYTASVLANGDIAACLDIERRPETVQGNILRDDFTKVWRTGFRTFRQDLAATSAACRGCSEREFCGGGAFHSWDYDRQCQKLCFKGVLF